MQEKETGKNGYLEKFMSVFNSLPIGEREQTIVVIDDQPISWNMAYIHLKNKTELGEKIGKKLVELDII